MISVMQHFPDKLSQASELLNVKTKIVPHFLTLAMKTSRLIKMWLAGKEMKSLKHPDTKNGTHDALDKLTIHERYD